MKKYIISVLLLALIITPALSYGAMDNNSLIIAQLRAQILLLQKQIASLQGQPTPTCLFNKDLSYGQGANDSLSSQVVLLQDALRVGGYLNIVKPTGYYGTMTRTAVRNWQRGNNLAVTGNIRASERAILCGSNDNGLNTVVIDSISGPTSIGINQTGTWELKVTAPANSNLTYSVDWGEPRSCAGGAGYTCSCSSGPCTESQDHGKFNHTYKQTGTYNVKFLVKSSRPALGQCPSNMSCDPVEDKAEASITVVVGEAIPNNPSVTILSPDGGETLVAGRPTLITWKTSGLSSSDNVKIYLNNSNIKCGPVPAPGCWENFIISGGVKNIGTYTWDTNTLSSSSGPDAIHLVSAVGSYSFPKASVYKIKLYVLDSNGKTIASDMSNSPFIITAN